MVVPWYGSPVWSSRPAGGPRVLGSHHPWYEPTNKNGMSHGFWSLLRWRLVKRFKKGSLFHGLLLIPPKKNWVGFHPPFFAKKPPGTRTFHCSYGFWSLFFGEFFGGDPPWLSMSLIGQGLDQMLLQDTDGTLTGRDQMSRNIRRGCVGNVGKAWGVLRLNNDRWDVFFLGGGPFRYIHFRAACCSSAAQFLRKHVCASGHKKNIASKMYRMYTLEN